MLKKILKKIIFVVFVGFLMAMAVDYAYGGRFYNFGKNKMLTWWSRDNADDTQTQMMLKYNKSQQTIDAGMEMKENHVSENVGEKFDALFQEIPGAEYDEFFTASFWKKAKVEDVLEKINNGARINSRNKNGMSILMYAAVLSPYSDVLGTLIEHGADVAARDENGRTALMWASAFSSYPEIVKTLVEIGSDTEHRDKQGRTPLMYAVAYNPNLEIVQELINCGAQVNAQVKAQPTALQRASLANQFLEITKLSLRTAGDFIGKMYHKLGDEVIGNQSDDTHGTMLMVLENSLDDLSGKIINPEEGMTPLMFAAKSARSGDVVDLLLDNGADVLIFDDKGKSFLDYAKDNPNLFNSDVYWKVNDKMYQ